MKAFRLSYMILFVALVFSSNSVFAQQNDNENVKEEEVIIIKEVVDENGKVEVKTITRTGDTEDIVIQTIDGDDVEVEVDLDGIEDIHVIKLEELEGLSEKLQEQLKDINIEIDEDQMSRKIKIIVDKVGEEGNPVIIEWEGEGEIPDDVKQKLEDNGIDWNGNHFNHGQSHGFIKGDHPKNKACLGVMIGKTVENENGVETVRGESEEGVTILDIIEDSGAEAAGLLKDDIITAVNGLEVSSIHDVLDVLKPYEGGETVAIDYLRNNQHAQVNATLKTCANKMKIKHFESHGTNDFEFDEEMNWVYENEEEEGNEIKRTIIIKKKTAETAPEAPEAKSNPTTKDEVAGIDTPGGIIEASISDLELQDFSLYPNPTEGVLNLAFESDAVPTTVKIVDISGKEVYKEELNNFNGTYKKEINLTEVPKGALMLTVTQDDKIFADKVMVQ